MKFICVASGAIALLITNHAKGVELNVPDKRFLIASKPAAEVRGAGDFFCVTPCITERSRLPPELTFSREGQKDVTLSLSLPNTPMGGVFDPVQNMNFELSTEFLFVFLGSTKSPESDDVIAPSPPH